jgi:GH25 family lysozyme M1 (1,4-beta-N-acetylmuramidase)
VTIYGMDCSNNNGSGISMAEVANEGFDFVFCKVSEGNYFQDSTWAGYRAAAQAAGLLLAGYHYAASSSTPASQVANFQKCVGDLTIPVMIDFENNSGTINDYWALVRAFNDAGQRVALSYIPQWYWSGTMGSPALARVPGLISSNYPGGSGHAGVIYDDVGGDSGPGWDAYGGATPQIWQFSDQASIAGYTLDANAFRGTRDQLATLLGVSS